MLIRIIIKCKALLEMINIWCRIFANSLQFGDVDTLASKRLWVDELQPGMRLSAPVMLKNQIVADENTVVTNKLINQLRRHVEILTVLVEADRPGRKLNARELKVQEKYEKTIEDVKSVFDQARETREVPINSIVELTSVTFDTLLKESFILDTLKSLRGVDEYTYYHSINVGVLCGVLGRWLKYDDDTVFMLVLSGLLHDIGKSQIPVEILNKPGRLNSEEMAIMRRHTVYGYDMLKKVTSIPEDVKMAVLQHHERNDATGYPFRLKEDKINDFAKIVAVADTYDAVTSNRVFQKAGTPFDVLEIFEEDMFLKMDSKICLPMLTQIKNSLIGRSVVLEDGRKASIVFVGTQSSDDMIIQTEEGELVSLGMRHYKNYFKDYIA